MAIAVRYAETEPQPQPRRANGLTGALLFAAAVFTLTLALLTLL
ncbi:hypothetical protein [Phenylobacterium sp.]|jgi:hypothetical protein|nr:hypothetical protein [Phenylobacterium sp.]HEX2562152.1 hypothetical protein [Phenylobacterium sp.]